MSGGVPILFDASIGTVLCLVALAILVVAFVRRRKAALKETQELEERLDAYRRVMADESPDDEEPLV